MCMWKCACKVINIDKYKQNCDDVTCNIKVETEIDVHSDVKQIVKWQVFRHVTETIRISKIELMCPSSGHWGGLGLWFPVYHPESTIIRRAPALTLYEHVFLSPSPHTCTLCPTFSLDPSVWPCKPLHLLEEGQNHPIVCFAYPCHMIGEEFVFFSFLYIKLFELGVEFAFNNQSAVSHHKVNLLTFPLRSSCTECTDDAFALLICFCFFDL